MTTAKYRNHHVVPIPTTIPPPPPGPPRVIAVAWKVDDYPSNGTEFEANMPTGLSINIANAVITVTATSQSVPADLLVYVRKIENTKIRVNVTALQPVSDFTLNAIIVQTGP
jgi:hypothetical protein